MSWPRSKDDESSLEDVGDLIGHDDSVALETDELLVGVDSRFNSMVGGFDLTGDRVSAGGGVDRFFDRKFIAMKGQKANVLVSGNLQRGEIQLAEVSSQRSVGLEL